MAGDPASEAVPADSSAPAFWEAHYGGPAAPPWDLGEPAPPFRSALARGDLAPPGRIALLGAGRGHDALLFARAGFEVVGFDFAAPAVAAATAAAEGAGLAARCRFLRRDIFSLGRDFAGAFDAVAEHTCFCAIEPARRAEYVDTVARILKPGGILLALFYLRPNDPNGPPWPSERADLERLFVAEGPFSLRRAHVPEDSHERRRGREWLASLELRESS
jgi:SAM-dependent methyltransferase